ncbi:MAG: hypothetical protein GJ676_20065 [Rhodobacteraceae bacterium]|nr:hypothetical protein [Paracoccaceae bacterium]
MDPDLALVVGIVIAGFAIPSVMSALSDRRAPRASMVTILIAGGLVLYATATKPGGYEIAEVPDVFFEVLGRFLP